MLCSGKVYYDLLEKRRAEGREDIAIVRIEQLYPFPEEELAEVIGPYTNLKQVVWCQEEPMNQGAWYCSQHHMRRVIERPRQVPGPGLRRPRGVGGTGMRLRLDACRAAGKTAAGCLHRLTPWRADPGRQWHA